MTLQNSIATIIGDSGITVTNGAGTITIGNTLPGAGNAIVLPDPTTSVALQGNTTYITTNTSGSPTDFQLPVSPTPGEFYQIIGGGDRGWRVSQNASQQIGCAGIIATTVGTSGYVEAGFTDPISNSSINF